MKPIAIVSLVEASFGLNEGEILTKSRANKFSIPRMVAVFLAQIEGQAMAVCEILGLDRGCSTKYPKKLVDKMKSDDILTSQVASLVETIGICDEEE